MGRVVQYGSLWHGAESGLQEGFFPCSRRTRMHMEFHNINKDLGYTYMVQLTISIRQGKQELK